MTAIQMLEQLAVNPSHKRDLVAGKAGTLTLATRAHTEIADLLKVQSKIWCALLPAEDEGSTTRDEPGKDSDEDAEEEQRSDN